MPDLSEFVDRDPLRELIRVARREDLGVSGVDVTSQALIDASATGSAQFCAREPGVLAGAAVLPTVIEVFEAELELTRSIEDGSALVTGDVIAEISGRLRDLLTVERTALNLLTHLSGVASLTRRYVDAVTGTRAQVCDTRKTLPGLRSLQKYAVACGGGTPHRRGLFDALLIKDNHLAGLAPEKWTQAVRIALEQARGAHPGLRFAMVEVDTLEQLQAVLPAGPDLVLLDNMPTHTLREAVDVRDRLAPSVRLEASGGVTLDTVASIAETGVDRVSVGALTHSAASLDIGLDRPDA